MRPTRRFLFAAVVAAATACSRSPSKSFEKGVAYYQEENHAKAAKCFEAALKDGGKTAQALTLLGVCHLNLSNTAAAASDFQEALKLQPDYRPARYDLALTYLEANNPEQAITQLRQLTQAPDCPGTIYYQLGRAYMRVGDWNQARQAFDKYGDARNNADAQNDLGIIDTHSGNFKQAKAHFQAAIDLDPNLPAVYLNLAILQHRYMGQKQDALPYYQRFLNLLPKDDPRSEEIRNTIAKLNQEVGSRVRTVEAAPPPKPVEPPKPPEPAPLQPTPVVEPPKPAPFVASVTNTTTPAVVPAPVTRLNAKRRTPVSIPSLKAGNHSKAETYFNEAVLMQQQSKLDAAISLYNKAIALDPAYATAYYNLSSAYREMNQFDKALEASEYALALNPNFGPAHLNYAILLQHQGYNIDAAAEYEKFSDSNPNQAEIHFVLASLYLHEGMKDKVRQHYLTYLKLVPNSPASRDIRDWLSKNP